MTRLWMFAIVAMVAMVTGFSQAGGAKDKAKEKEKDVEIKGKFTKDDPKDEQRGGPSQTHVVSMKAGSVYTIDMVSTAVDSYLRLVDEKGKVLEEDDDSGGDLNSRIIFSCTKDGKYQLVCTTFGAGGLGDYILTVKSSGSVSKPTSSHTQLVGKAAPDVLGDFAINGNTAKLADLKGKVVLLHFWEVRSTSSIALQPQLNDWNKVYKTKGLAIVGLTFYPSDINQRLGFDKENGKLTTVKKADRQSDQELLNAFAAYHKIDHLLMALSKKNALDAFDAYSVNGLPQLVLIDRQGMIQLLDVGGEKNRANVESEIKKLLAEK